jgi:hypothetical protein
VLALSLLAFGAGAVGCLTHPDDGSDGAASGAGGDTLPPGTGGEQNVGSGGHAGSGAGGNGAGGSGAGGSAAGGRGGNGAGGNGAGGSAAGGRGGNGAGGAGVGGSGMGGRGMGGASMGGSGMGGAQATACNIGPANNGSGSFTEYWFSQCSGCQQNPYTTACGYQGNEPSGMSSDMIKNIPTPGYFAAIPGNSSSDFNTSKYCGACAQLSNGGKSVVVTIVDECPENSNQPCKDNPNGHLDLSVAAFNALGFPTGNPKGTTWKFVPCPVTSASPNVIVRIKQGNQNEIFIENEITPIASVTFNGSQAVRQSYGAWHWDGVNLGSGSTLTLTDIAGRTIMVTLTSGTQNQNQDTGKQFPPCQ